MTQIFYYRDDKLIGANTFNTFKLNSECITIIYRFIDKFPEVNRVELEQSGIKSIHNLRYNYNESSNK